MGDAGKPWYKGKVVEYSAATGAHLILYDDGELKSHNLAAEEQSGQLRWLSPAVSKPAPAPKQPKGKTAASASEAKANCPACQGAHRAHICGKRSLSPLAQAADAALQTLKCAVQKAPSRAKKNKASAKQLAKPPAKPTQKPSAKLPTKPAAKPKAKPTASRPTEAAQGRSKPPPGWKVVRHDAPAKSYNVFHGPKGQKEYSLPGAWRAHDAAGAKPSKAIAKRVKAARPASANEKAPKGTAGGIRSRALRINMLSSEYIGRRVSIRWTGDAGQPWYKGTIAEFYRASDEYLVVYGVPARIEHSYACRTLLALTFRSKFSRRETDDGEQKAHNLAEEQAAKQLMWL